MELLNEAKRNELLNKSKSSNKGKQRFNRRGKSKVANSVKNYNEIDMNKLFKEGILTVNVNVTGETDDYVVKMKFGGFLDNLQNELKRPNTEFSLRIVIKALNTCFNNDDVYIFCTCPDFKYRYHFWATQNDFNSGDPQNDNGKRIRNPDDRLGSACKHVLLVLSNNSWLIKTSSVIVNYTNYMKQHYENMYAKVIYPAIYGKEYEEPYQISMFDDNELQTDKNIVDTSNKYAVDKTKFQKGNTQGIRFISNKEENQRSLLNDENERTLLNDET